MKAFNILKVSVVSLAMLTISSCGDAFLTSSSTEQLEAGQTATDASILSNLGAAYQILMFDSYANSNYNSLPLMSDLRSDDIFKGGGSLGDQSQLYKLSQFTSTSAEDITGLWLIYYSGVARANNVLISCNNAPSVSAANLAQYKAEAHFLRAYYMHLLWKFWGNIPFYEGLLDKPPYMAKQYSADEIYAKIMADVDSACIKDALPMQNTQANLGRVNRAAALMLKARVVMYQKDASRYAEVTSDMAEIINSGAYGLMSDFGAIWDDANEFCKESIFESNQLPTGKTWSNGWAGYGTNLPAFISPNELNDASGVFKGGWGFGPVRQAAYDMYESGDTRRSGSINLWSRDNYVPRFQDTGLFQRKYAARVGYNPPPGDVDLNYCNNFRIFRYAETLLNYVEMVAMNGQSEVSGVSAQNCFDQIRTRAFGSPNPIAMTPANIKLERRREFLGEGMRFWDLVRWGDTNLLNDNLPAFNSVRTWQDYMKYLPIPQSDIDNTSNTEFALKQNPGWN